MLQHNNKPSILQCTYPYPADELSLKFKPIAMKLEAH